MVRAAVWLCHDGIAGILSTNLIFYLEFSENKWCERAQQTLADQERSVEFLNWIIHKREARINIRGVNGIFEKFIIDAGAEAGRGGELSTWKRKRERGIVGAGIRINSIFSWSCIERLLKSISSLRQWRTCEDNGVTLQGRSQPGHTWYRSPNRDVDARELLTKEEAVKVKCSCPASIQRDSRILIDRSRRDFTFFLILYLPAHRRVITHESKRFFRLLSNNKASAFFFSFARKLQRSWNLILTTKFLNGICLGEFDTDDEINVAYTFFSFLMQAFYKWKVFYFDKIFDSFWQKIWDFRHYPSRRWRYLSFIFTV